MSERENDQVSEWRGRVELMCVCVCCCCRGMNNVLRKLGSDGTEAYITVIILSNTRGNESSGKKIYIYSVHAILYRKRIF